LCPVGYQPEGFGGNVTEGTVQEVAGAPSVVDGGDAVGEVENQLLRGEVVRGAFAGEEVRVHVGQPRHQELPAPVNLCGAGRDFSLTRGADFDDASVAHDDRLIWGGLF
jgi:hypothetical protein